MFNKSVQMYLFAGPSIDRFSNLYLRVLIQFPLSPITTPLTRIGAPHLCFPITQDKMLL